MPVKIFFSYAQEDRIWRVRLNAHLGVVRRLGQANTWYDGEITPGSQWKDEISEQLNTADIILLLVSPDFINSDYCYGTEMMRAMERNERGEARVIPIILRSVDWEGAPFSGLKVLPINGVPINLWSDTDQALNDVAKGIRRVVEEVATENININYADIITAIQDMQKDLISRFQSLGLVTRWIANLSLEEEQGYEVASKMIQAAQKSIYIISDYIPPNKAISYTENRKNYLSSFEEKVSKNIVSKTQFDYKRILQSVKASEITRVLKRSHLAGDEQTFEHCKNVMQLISGERSNVTVQLFVSEPLPSLPSIMIVDQRFILMTIPGKKGAIESLAKYFGDFATFGMLFIEDYIGKLSADFTKIFNGIADDSVIIANVEK